jgi:hypothetical protein
MKRTLLAASIALAAGTLAIGTLAAAAPARSKPDTEKSADVLRARQLGRIEASRAAPPADSSTFAAALAPAVEDVGDADSFGKNVTYIGLAQSQSVTLTDDCTGSDPTVERCIVSAPAPSLTSFNEADLAVVNLPAKATKSLICFTLTPSIFIDWVNFTGTTQTARFQAIADITIDNPVLDDPALIDPTTGLPFGGSLVQGLTTWSHLKTIQPNEHEQERSFQSRGCIAGIISKRQLVETFGLTDTLAKEFFKKPMTIHFGARGSVAMSQFTQYFYGIRLYGD